MEWFRFYNEVLDDPKVQTLPAEDFKHWVNILCVVSRQDKNGVLPSLEELAFSLRIDTNGARTLLERLCERCLIDRCNGGVNGYSYVCHGWGKRQYKSDSSNERVKRYRNKRCNVTVTPPETDTETETETDKPKEKRARGKSSRFTPPKVDEVREYCNGRDSPVDPEKFVDFYTSKGWMVGRNAMKDWKAAVRNWEKGDGSNRTGKREAIGRAKKPGRLDIPTREGTDYAAGF